MPIATPSAVSDPARLAALDAYAILDTPPEAGFDDIVHLACRLCDVPVALVSFVAADRQWFKARAGFPDCETNLGSSVCAHALTHPDRVLVIPDLTADPRTAGNPLVTGEPFIRFYAGAPLVSPEGHVLGSLCVIDHRPRPDGLSETQTEDLVLLARQVMAQLALRRAVLARDFLQMEELRAFTVREALRDTQTALADADGDLDGVLRAVVDGAMRAVPAAEGCVVELIDGDHLEYRAVAGSLEPHRGLRVPLGGSLAGQCATSRTPLRMADAYTDPYVRRDLVKRLGLRSAVVAPILRGDVALGVLKLQSSRVDAFTDSDLVQVGMFASAATTGLGAAGTRRQMRAQDAYWRSLFDRLVEGFVVGEIVRDAGGRAVDWRYVEVNPAWGNLVGIEAAAAVGRTVREVLPGIEEAWITDFAQVVETGEPATFTRPVGVLRRWYDGRAFRLEGDRFGVIFMEATGRVQAEGRRNALLALGDELRDLNSIPHMTRIAAEIVGRALDATRAGFGRIVGDVEHIDIEPDWTAPGTASIAGRHRFEDYGDIRGHLRRGEPLVIDDVATDPRTRDGAAAWEAVGIRSLVNMPVRERGRTVAVFIVHDMHPRVWAPEELVFLRNVADRVEAGVARVRAEENQSVLNRELAHRLKNTLTVVQSIASQTLRGVTERDRVETFERRVLALSRAHDVLLERNWSTARLRAVTENVLAMQADLGRFALEGPDMEVGPQAALSLSLLLHELATNALKYGALSAESGRVRISWRTEDAREPVLILGWVESGGPPVTPPGGRGGFGSRLIRMGLLGTRDARLGFEPEGLRAEFRAPLADVQGQVH
ncbi:MULTISPECIES: GAF domain-containing protein [Methylobacterium]|uniref:histidine kinase n=4 Tax=Pseudomonadota TaxID=1224 RepID=A0ABQ4T126_9HYPH|nr:MULTISPECIES: GAF domain-containing protein [Methylobacterium]PIU04630.1 MAG: histidine kinase [Methylobacterium sp. CG09_land_8_20_14_0_10_71_15]PIU14401.1 MAG: histidine kinase [Methylobacterium sp. CG08_land_8_20_14_0_20_71_15]GBU19410.1 hypothetical protein AwMethylo_36250 [Methylobacterium sp.]GJE08458.1 hypothetical protein AOPFMNJM_3795 [Methylobacterium jeotgali]